MPIIYDVYINGEPVKEEIGFTIVESGEERLDSGIIKIPNINRRDPFPMLSLVQIKKKVIDNYVDQNVLSVRTKEMLVISDTVEQAGSYGYYNHTLNMAEYTHKLDYYLQASLVETFGVEDNRSAPYTFTRNRRNVSIDNLLYSNFTLYDILPPIDVKATYRDRFKLKATGKAVVGKELTQIGAGTEVYGRVESDTFIKFSFDNKIINTTYEDVDVELPKGEWIMEYGYYGAGDIPRPIYRYHIRALKTEDITVYDLVMNVRNNVSKYGGIESKKYFDSTRLFDLDKETEEFLKSVTAPQVFLENATARQMLIFVLQYVNALPKLKHDGGIDKLGLIRYNEYEGEFQINDVSGYSATHNTNQIGSRSYSPLKQVLPSDLNEPNMFSPMKDGFKTVRAKDVQLTDTSYELKLERKLYKPIKLEAVIPVTFLYEHLSYGKQKHQEDIVLDLTDMLLNKAEYDVKDVAKEFPVPESVGLYSDDLGLLPYKYNQIYWTEGATSIDLSGTVGELFKEPKLKYVLDAALKRWILNTDFRDSYFGNIFVPHDDPTGLIKERYNAIFEVDAQFYLTSEEIPKKVSFNIEYITEEDTTLRQEKEDVSEINFYSEMRLNQEESVLDLVKASRKSYGDLQRTGNKELRFLKIHKDFNDMYKIGQTDVNDYTITNITKQYFNEYIIATYDLTKHHNRISQATYVDQTYRWRDNYANKAVNRHENYTDYVFIVPRNDNSIKSEDNKIMTKTETLRNMIGVLGTEYSSNYVNNSKATVALIRTDGFLNYYEKESKELFKDIALITPVSSFGIKGGFVFNLGFENNQLAGPSIIRKNISGKFNIGRFNREIRYTDFDGRFKYFDFHIFNKYDLELKEEDYDYYPLVVKNDLSSKRQDDLLMFGTGHIQYKDLSNDSLVVNKDPLTNFKLTYGLNVMSYYTGLFIIGQKFYTNNPLVNNKTQEQKYLYVYDDGTQYKIFDDLKIKEGYYRKIPISRDVINYDSFSQVLSISGIRTSDTSWAIGNDVGDLYLACNEALNGFELVDRHIRPNIYEIGSQFVELGGDDWGSNVPEIPSEPELPIDPEQPEKPSIDYYFNGEFNIVFFNNLDTMNGLDIDLNDEIRLSASLEVPDYEEYVVGIKLVDDIDTLDQTNYIELDDKIEFGVNLTNIDNVYANFDLMLELEDDLLITQQNEVILDDIINVGVNTSTEHQYIYNGAFNVRLNDDITIPSANVIRLDDNIRLGVSFAYSIDGSYSGNLRIKLDDDMKVDSYLGLDLSDTIKVGPDLSIKHEVPLDTNLTIVLSDDMEKSDAVKVDLNDQIKLGVDLRSYSYEIMPKPIILDTYCEASLSTGSKTAVIEVMNNSPFDALITAEHHGRVNLGPYQKGYIRIPNIHPDAKYRQYVIEAYNENIGVSEAQLVRVMTEICIIV